MREKEKKDITEKYILMGVIETLSPLHIGSGFDDRSDMDILLDSNNTPFIPATSLIGVLRHMIQSEYPDNPKIKQFWGFVEKKNQNEKNPQARQEASQSRVYCSDLLCCSENFKIDIRDGIRIDHSTGIVEDNGKFTFEILERGTRFQLKMEFDVHVNESQFTKQMIATIVDILKNKDVQKDNTKISYQRPFQLGAKTNNGLGNIKLVKNSEKLYQFDFSEKSHVFRWITQDFNDDQQAAFQNLGEPLSVQSNPFIIKAHFHLKDSLIIRSYSDDPKMPDATHLKSKDDWVLSGSSIKGAIRARAERILNTLGIKTLTIADIFGYVPDKDDARDKSKRAKKGNILVSETILPRFISEMQSRIKIDRLTGGTIDTALFDTMPVFSDLNEKELIITVHLNDLKSNKMKASAGLLLLVLKDLWTGDLAIGGEKNVGRGTLQGISATIIYEGKKIDINKGFIPENESDKDCLTNLVNALILGGNNGN